MDLLGQVSYRPVDGAEAGDLCLNRITEHPPQCQQLTPFEQWFPPTRTSVPLPPSTIFQRSKSQRNWLYKTHPEAFLGNVGLPKLISEETRAQEAARPDAHNGSILAVGEIVDLRNSKSSRVAKCPVVALAAGEAGHILMLSVVNSEKWLWNDSSFALGIPQRKFQGSWCSDGSPISKLEFATKLKQYNKLRWLIVQKETSTTIFEPEIRAKPVAATTSMSDTVAADHIVMNPVVTLSIDATGGESHCDFSMNLGSNDLAPQLAVIDRSGNWSVWHIGREGYGRGKTTKAILLKKGSSTLPMSVPSEPSFLVNPYKIAWTTRSQEANDWERDSSPSVQSDSLNDGENAAYAIELDEVLPKYDGLLVCNHSGLQVTDVSGAGHSPSLAFSKRDGVDALLDTQTFHGSSSHVLVLTTDKLYLLDVSSSEGRANGPSIIASCRHYRSSSQETLKMSVTRLPSSKKKLGCLISIHSAHRFRVDLFWFTIAQSDDTAQFHRQVVHFPGLDTASMEDPQGIESLAAVPLHLPPSKGKQRQEAEEAANSFADVQLYQLFALTTSLGLSTSIVALSHGAQHDLPIPVKRDKMLWTDARRATVLRRKWLRDTEHAFVIPDQVEEVKLLISAKVSSQSIKRNTIQLRSYLLRLMREINHGFFGDAAGNAVKDSGSAYLKPIREALKRQEDDHVALKPLLGFSNLWEPLELSVLEDEVDFSLRQFKKSEEWQLFECGSYGPKQSAMDLFEKISTNWSSEIPAEAFKATQWRYIELALERMAAEVYLSEKGFYKAPKSTLDLAAKCLPQEQTLIKGEDDLDSQPWSSQGMCTPSATPSSSRAASEGFASSQNSQSDDEQETGKEDPAVARLRLYLPSIKFTPPPKAGPSRVISLWPEHRGVDPFEYRYRPPGSGPDEKAEATRRRREKNEERRRLRAERRALLGIKLEGVGESFSQPYRPTGSFSSPPPGRAGSSQPPVIFDRGTLDSSQSQVESSQAVPESSQPQAQSQGTAGFGLESLRKSHTAKFTAGAGFSQTMSQPLAGEFGGGNVRSRKKQKKAAKAGFR